MPRGRPTKAQREEAAVWCSILACDRATNAWTIRLAPPHTHWDRAMQLAWKTRVEAQRDNEERCGRHYTAAEMWAEAEARIRSGRP